MTGNDPRSLNFVSDQLTDGRSVLGSDRHRRLHQRMPGSRRRVVDEQSHLERRKCPARPFRQLLPLRQSTLSFRCVDRQQIELPEEAPERLQRKTASPFASSSPNQGCHGYKSSRTSVLWVFRCLVVQRSPTALWPMLADGCRVRQTVNPQRDAVLRSRNGSAPQPAATPADAATQNRRSELKTG